MILGFIFSMIVSVLFAAYAVPRKHSKQNVILYTMWMGISYFICTVILICVIWGFGFEKPENLLSSYHLLTVLRGFIWVLGMAAYNLAIDKIGLARFNQWKNIQGPVGSLLILLIVIPALGLGISTTKLLCLVFGIAVMFASALLFQVKNDVGQECKDTVQESANAKKSAKLGIVCALFSGTCFGFAALLNSWVSQSTLVGGNTFTFAQLFYHSSSLIIFSILIYMILGNRANKPSTIKQKVKDIFRVNRKTWLPVIAGFMFIVATILTIYSYRLIENNAIPWSISQLNVFWTFIIGVFFYKEINYKQHRVRLLGGTIMAVAACVLLFFAM